MYKDVFGHALADYYLGHTEAPLMLHNNYGDTEEMPVDIFFRAPGEFPELELIALALCDGKTLDIGAGAGSHALYLQEKGMDVTALEISALACDVMRERGVVNILNHDIFNFSADRYDTLLMLMNGIGLSGELERLPTLLETCKGLLNKGGQMLFDSSDIKYVYDDPHTPKPPVSYYGEVTFQYEYRSVQGSPFKWLYVDQQTLIDMGQRMGWVVQILYEDEHDQYLARMEVRE